MFLINKTDSSGDPVPITHQCEKAEDIGKPMTEKELFAFAVSLVMVSYYKQGGKIKFMDYTMDRDVPNIIMENEELAMTYYVKIMLFYITEEPALPPQDYYKDLIEMAEEAGANPVIIGVEFEHVKEKGREEMLCGDRFIVRHTAPVSLTG